MKERLFSTYISVHKYSDISNRKVNLNRIIKFTIVFFILWLYVFYKWFHERINDYALYETTKYLNTHEQTCTFTPIPFIGQPAKRS